MYKVIKRFHDLQDSRKTKTGVIYHEYKVGDVFPRDGSKASDERIKELAGSANKRGVPLIKLVDDQKVQKPAAKG